uniref:Uncharacterized protein n=1 Tax=Ananas comosus var. bracteatus TaxID=296719 RepID=A0A6V7QC80_ANACO|nr:unnamed protein product [Ananas comosus var. bracteatus]
MPRRGRPPLSASGERSRVRPSTRTHLPPPETLDQAGPSESQGLREQGWPSHLRECVRALGRCRLDRTYESVMAIGFHDCCCRRRPYPLGTAISSSHALLWSPLSVTGTSSVERATVLSFGLARARAICLYLILGVELCILLLISCCSVV